MLGRRHAFEDFREGVRAARDAGFDRISADLIFGLPGQTPIEWEQTLRLVLREGVSHISCYSLSLEEGTPLARDVASGALPAPDDEADREMYHCAHSVLAAAGMHQYEISNFAQPGCECLHNIKYWTGAPYRGFGAGAASFDGARRFVNARGIVEYIARSDMHMSEAAAVEHERIDDAEAEKEYVILRLRLCSGLRLDDYARRFGVLFEERHAAALAKFTSEGLLSYSHATSRVALTPKGMDVANRVFAAFI
jgi:oxygen-independent coproporphyrinogen-3 oxidase